MEAQPIRFTSSFYGITPEVRSKADIPTAIAIDPVPENLTLNQTNLCACSKCRAYIGPHSKIDMNTRTWTCAFCKTSNNLPIENMQILDNCELPTQTITPPRSMYIIDCSSSALNGLIQTIIPELEARLKGKCKNVCVALLAEGLHVIGPNGGITSYPDLEEIEIPPKYFHEEFPSLELFNNLQTDKRGPFIMSALNVAINSVGNNGRVFVATSFRTAEKDCFNTVNVNAEGAAIRGVNYEVIQELLHKFRQNLVTLNMLIAPGNTTLIDCATFARFCVETGGRCEYLTKPGFYSFSEALDRLLQPKIVGSFSISCIDTILPSIGISQHSPSGFMVTKGESLVFPFGLDPNNPSGEINSQLSVTEYDIDGQVRKFVYNKTIRTTDVLTDIFKEIDQDVILKYISNTLIYLFKIGHEFSSLKGSCLALLKPMFMSYRIHVSRSPNRFSSIVLPKSLNTILIKCLGILKSTALAQSISYDERAIQMMQMSQMTPNQLALAACPVLTDVTEFVANGGDIIRLPLTESSLRPGKILILDNGFYTHLWLGNELNKELVQATFMKPAQSLVDELIPFQTDQSRRLFSLLRGNFRMSKQDAQSDYLFRQRMIEDDNNKLPSYSAFTGELHSITLPQRKEDKITTKLWDFAVSIFTTND